MSTIMRWAIVGLMFFAGVTAAQAQVRSVKLFTPRLFGYFVGDVVRSEVDITVDPEVELVPASVPSPGPLNSWIELISSRFEKGSAGDAKLYRFYFEYQNFYPALDSRYLDIPGFPISFTAGSKTVTAQVPQWSFLISSLREVLPEAKASGADYMQPDVDPPSFDLRRDLIGFLVLLAASLVALALLAYHLAWWPFASRPQRPFTEAARRIRKVLDVNQRGVGYRDALLTLHRAVDAAAGHAVFAEDLPEFLGQMPAFSELAEEFNQFFRSSRQMFFGDDLAGATNDFSPNELRKFSYRLAAVERASR
jgi:mxaA protein